MRSRPAGRLLSARHLQREKANCYRVRVRVRFKIRLRVRVRLGVSASTLPMLVRLPGRLVSAREEQSLTGWG